jgi:hypothetical protein
MRDRQRRHQFNTDWFGRVEQKTSQTRSLTLFEAFAWLVQ